MTSKKLFIHPVQKSQSHTEQHFFDKIPEKRMLPKKCPDDD